MMRSGMMISQVTMSAMNSNERSIDLSAVKCFVLMMKIELIIILMKALE